MTSCQIYAANNLFKGILKYANNGGALLGGIIGNSINNEDNMTWLQILEWKLIPSNDYVTRSLIVTKCELNSMITIEGAPWFKTGKYLQETYRKNYSKRS